MDFPFSKATIKSMSKQPQIRYFRLLTGTHYDENETLFVAKDPKRNVVKSHDNLCKLWRNKFEEITERVAAERQAAKDEIVSELADLGKDVTYKFPKIKKKGHLRVFRNSAKEYNVVDANGDLSKPINNKPLSKEAVAGFASLQTA